MSVHSTLFRYTRIIKKLRRGPASLETLSSFLEIECEIHDVKCEFSKRTFLRDKNAILSLFNIEINYCPYTRRYSIDQFDLEEMPPEGSHVLHYLI
jgi:predicted DNA-binding transcriptional regulator YafY